MLFYYWLKIEVKIKRFKNIKKQEISDTIFTQHVTPGISVTRRQCGYSSDGRGADLSPYRCRIT